MAREMDVSMDDMLSAIAEESVSELGGVSEFLDDVFIPERCSTTDLLKLID